MCKIPSQKFAILDISGSFDPYSGVSFATKLIGTFEETTMQTTFKRATQTLSDAAKSGMNGVNKLASKTERAVAKVPPGVYMAFGLDCCIAASVLYILGQRKAAHAVATWAPVSMMLGIYSKLEQKREHWADETTA